MALNSLMQVLRRGGASDTSPFTAQGNELNELIVAQGLPAYTEMNRKGTGWTIQTSTLFAPLTAVPTTTAALELWNNTNSGVNLIVDTLFADMILGTAASQTAAIYAMVTIPKAVPSLTALTVASTSGRSPYTSAVGTPIVTGVGTTVIANGWRPWGNPRVFATATATPGDSWHTEVNGRLLVPPGCSLCLHIVGALATASSFLVGASIFTAPITTLA